MGKKSEMGCKKCGGVIHSEMIVSSFKIEVNLEHATGYDHYGVPEIKCKKCGAAVARVRVEPL